MLRDPFLFMISFSSLLTDWDSCRLRPTV